MSSYTCLDRIGGDPIDVWHLDALSDAWLTEVDVDVEEAAELPPAPGVLAWDRLSDQLAVDADLDAGDLVQVLAHCASTVSAAQFRMMQAASLIHEVARRSTPSG